MNPQFKKVHDERDKTLKMKQKSENKVKVDEELLLSKKRLYVGGLPESITEKDLVDRFKSFGHVEKVQIALNQDGTGCRGFAHLTMTFHHPSQMKKCFQIYNKSKWKGIQLKLEEAKEDFLEKLKRERIELKNRPDTQHSQNQQQQQLLPGDSKMRKKFKKGSLKIEHAKNMNIVQDDEPLREGWKRGKFGRPVAVIHLKDMRTRKIIEIDPSSIQHNLKRFKDSDLEKIANMKLPNERYVPVTCNIEHEMMDIDDENNQEEAVATPDYHQAFSLSYKLCQTDMKSEDHDNNTDSVVPEHTKVDKNIITTDLVNEKQEEKNVINEDIDDQRIQQISHEIENSNREGENEDKGILDDQTFQKEKKFAMDIMKQIFGGSSSNSTEKIDSVGDHQNQEPLSNSVEDKTDVSVSNKVVWKKPIRFDPTMPDSSSLLLPDEVANDETLNEINDDLAPSKIGNGIFKVNTNLRSLVFGNPTDRTITEENSNSEKPSQSFSLSKEFGFSVDEGIDGDEKTDEGINNTFSQFQMSSENDQNKLSLKRDSVIAAAPLFSTSKLFFIHFDQPEFMESNRTIYKPTFTFRRNQTIDEITTQWEMKRQEWTEEYKRKHRSTFRKKKKITKN